MSVVVAIKYRDGVAIAADKQATGYHTKDNNVNKIAHYKQSNTAIGVVGYLRDCNVMFIQNGLQDAIDVLEKKKVDFKYVVSKIVPNIFAILGRHKRIVEEDGVQNMLSTMLFCTHDNIYTIYHDGGVVERDKWAAIGCGEDLVSGFLETIKNFDKLTKEAVTHILEKCIKQCCKNDAYINDNIDYIYLEK